MARYRKIDPRLWKDEKFQRLSSEQKLIAIYLMTAQSNRIGLFNFSPALATEDLGVDSESFREAFGKVSQALNWGWDKASRVLFIPTWWKYNTPENPNVLIACLSDVHEIPETRLVQQFWSNEKHLPEAYLKAFRKLRQSFGKASGKVTPQEQEQEQKQEQEQEQKQEKKSGAPAPATLAAEGLVVIADRRKPPHIDFVDRFKALYELQAQRPFKDDKHHYVVADRLIKKFGLDIVIEKAKVLAVLCKHKSTWFTKDGWADFTIEKLSSQWNGIIPEAIKTPEDPDAEFLKQLQKEREHSARVNSVIN